MLKARWKEWNCLELARKVDPRSRRCELRRRWNDDGRRWCDGKGGCGGMGGPRWSRQDLELAHESEGGRAMRPRQEGCGRGHGKELGLMMDPGQEGCGRGRGGRGTVSRRWDPGRGRSCAGWKGRMKDGCCQCLRME